MNKLYAIALLTLFFGGTVFSMERPIPTAVENPKKSAEKLLLAGLKAGNLEEVKQFFDQSGTDVNALLKKSWTSLMVAALHGHEHIVRYLINDKKANVHFAAEDDGATAVIIAAHKGHMNVIKCIFEEQKTNPHSKKQLLNAVDNNGFNALYHAASAGKLDVARYLVELGEFNPHIEGTVALSLANRNKHNAVVQYLISKGVSDLPKQENSDGIKNIFYSAQANKLFELDYFDILAYTSMPIPPSTAIQSMAQGGKMHIYLPRVLEQSYLNDNFLTEQLKNAQVKLGGTATMHRETSPIFGGSCAYHALKNAFVGLMLLHDYDILAQECTTNTDPEKLKTCAQFVSEDINSLTALKTPQFNSADFMEKLHAQMVMVQPERSLLKKLEASNIQQAAGRERVHIARHEFDSIFHSTMARRHANFQHKNNALLTFVDYKNLGRNICNLEYGNIYQNKNAQLNIMLETLQNFELKTQIAFFRKNNIYRHAFNLSLHISDRTGWGQGERMHAITVILDKRDSVINVIVFESNNTATFAIKQILFDFIDLFIDSNKYPLPDVQINDLTASYPTASYGIAITKNQSKLPTLEALIQCYSELKPICDSNKKREDVHKALFLLSKISHIYTQAKDCDDHGIAKDEFKRIEKVLASHDLLLQANQLREEEISLYNTLQTIEAKELNERMFHFIMIDDTANITETIKIGANPNGTNSSGQTPLCNAAYRNLGTVKCLVENGANVNLKNKKGQTALMIAAERGDCTMIEYLMQRDAQINAQDENGCTPLMYVAGFFGADQKRLETVKLLLEKYKAALTIKNNAGQTALMVHAICGAIDVFDYLIKEHNMTIDLATLVRCIAYEEVVFGMGSYGPVFNPLPFIDYCIKKLGLTAQAQPALTQDLAIAAVKKYNIDVIQRLCQKDCGFDINTQDAEGWTMLMHVCDSKYGNIFQKIIEEFKPNIYAKNNASKTAFDIAAQYGNTLILDYFIKNCGFTIETCDSNGLTPLHHAAANVNLGTLENLIRFYNANIHAKDNNGRTALMIVAGNHDTGAKCKARECDQEKSESSRWHRPKSHAEIAHYLIEHGIDINTVDNNGRTALMHAEAAGRKEVIEYLKTGKINNDSQKEPSLLFNPFDID